MALKRGFLVLSLLLIVFSCGKQQEPTAPEATENDIVSVSGNGFRNQGPQIQAASPVFEAATPCGETLVVEATGQLTFPVRVSDADAGDEVELKVANLEGLPAGASVMPELPVTANPVKTKFTWSPGLDQLGMWDVNFRAKDLDENSTDCAVEVEVVLAAGSAPFFDSRSPCGETLTVAVGSTINFKMKVSDADSGDEVELKVANLEGLPAGATTNPELPDTANPVRTTFTWTPTGDQVGEWIPIFRAKDLSDLTTECEVTINVTN